MTKNFTYSEKHNGDQLNASEWNSLAQDVDAAVDAINNGIGGSDPHIVFDSADKHNLTIETTLSDQYEKNGQMKGGKINIEPISDLQIKPGDDVVICSHHREDPTEVSVKIHDGNDNPVKLQVNTANIVLTTKDKNKTKEKDENGDDTSTALYDDPTVMNITVNSAKNTRGYLKVRAQAIDLRCEADGGIALQPKGADNKGNENKIKFEHDGGDGAEFGTFNTEKTSIFTDEYRFKEDGRIYAVKRVGPEPIREDPNDLNSEIKKVDYITQNDDFKDIPVVDDGTECKWDDSTNEWVAPSGHTAEEILSCSWRDIIVAVNYIKSQNPSLHWTQTPSNL